MLCAKTLQSTFSAFKRDNLTGYCQLYRATCTHSNMVGFQSDISPWNTAIEQVKLFVYENKFCLILSLGVIVQLHPKFHHKRVNWCANQVENYYKNIRGKLSELIFFRHLSTDAKCYQHDSRREVKACNVSWREGTATIWVKEFFFNFFDLSVIKCHYIYIYFFLPRLGSHRWGARPPLRRG